MVRPTEKSYSIIQQISPNSHWWFLADISPISHMIWEIIACYDFSDQMISRRCSRSHMISRRFLAEKSYDSRRSRFLPPSVISRREIGEKSPVWIRLISKRIWHSICFNLLVKLYLSSSMCPSTVTELHDMTWQSDAIRVCFVNKHAWHDEITSRQYYCFLCSQPMTSSSSNHQHDHIMFGKTQTFL